ncbi:MAG: TonB-dependent receptor [Acidipila sp.]|nr:TonB-dependent receptor [Acidipila sp.]
MQNSNWLGRLSPWEPTAVRLTSRVPANDQIGRNPRFRTVPFFLWAGLFLLLGSAGVARAQKDAGGIAGTVRDVSGAVIPAANVFVRDAERGTTFTTATNASGEYVASPLKVGRYTVTVEHSGFKKAVSVAVDLDVQQRIVIDMTLQVGDLGTETVTVQTSTPLLDSEVSGLGAVVENKSIQNLPLNGRNFAQLALTVPGTVPSEPGSRDEQSFGFSSNGARSLQNNFLLDGIDNNSNLPDLLNETNYVIQPALDALQEFKVQTNAYSAEFGRGNGAIINASIKSGTNKWHGSVYEYLRNEKLDARNAFDPAQIPPYKQNQFGVTFGGPVIIPHVYDGHNRTFFFVDYAGLRVRQAQSVALFVPTPAQVAGDFSASLTGSPAFAVDPTTGLPTAQVALDCAGRPTFAGEIFNTRLTQSSNLNPNGFCGVPIGVDLAGNPTNIFPNAAIDPLGSRLAMLYPAPNVLNDPALNFKASPVLRQTRNNFDVRLDHKFSDMDTSFVRFSYEDQPSVIPASFPGIGDGGGFFSGVEANTYHSLALSEVHIFRPTLINEFRFGYNRAHSQRFNFNADKDISAQIGFPGVPFGPMIGGLPQLTFNDAPTLGSPTFLPSLEIQNTYSLSDDLTWIKSNHTVKFGTEIRHEEFTIFQPAAPRGMLSFSSQFTDNPASPGSGGSGLASLLAGLTDGGSINNLHNMDYFRPIYSFYAQDDWKVTRNLTLNLGLRYELFTTVKERNNQQGTFDLNQPLTPTIVVPKGQTAQLTPCLATGTPPCAMLRLSATGTRGLIKPDLNNFAPRIGFAYKLTERTVLRGGYGVFYGGQENGPYSNPSPGFNPPFFAGQSFSTSCSAASANPAAGALDCSVPGLSSLQQGFPATSLTDPNTPLLFSVDPQLRTPYLQQWHLSVQRELPGNSIVEITYAGSKGSELFTFFNGNQSTPTADPAAPSAPRRPVPAFDAPINWFRSTGISNYNSLQVRAEKRFSRGFSFLMAYTWAHSLDIASNSNLGAQNNSDFRDLRFPMREYGNSDFDVRHRFVVSYVYELPFGHGKRWLQNAGSVVDKIVGDWQLSGITSISTGNYFTVTDGNGNFSNSDGGPSGVSQRPDVIANPRATPCVAGTFFNTCAFADPPLGSFGNVGRNTLQGPGYQVWDMSLLKVFRIGESKEIQFRSDFFNLPNHTNKLLAKSGPQQGNNSSDLGSPNFGFLTAARPPRQIQFSLRFAF